MITVVIPLADDMGDCNWFDWVAVGIERDVLGETEPTRERVREIVRSVKLYDHQDEELDVDVAGFMQALRLAISHAGFTVNFMGTGKLEWPGL